MSHKLAFLVAMVVVVMALSAAPALAHDHLFNATNSSGAAVRGFANPVAGNPSGTSGAMARPATVPGAGDPKVGVDQGTPAVDLTQVGIRTDGHGQPQH